MKCLLYDKPRSLSLKALNWNDNPLVRCFRGCGHSDGFMKVWKQNFVPVIDKVTGMYSTGFRDLNSPPIVGDKRRSSTPSSSTSSKSTTPTSLLPASKRARIEKEGSSTALLEETGIYNEGEMDNTIKEHFLGKHMP